MTNAKRLVSAAKKYLRFSILFFCVVAFGLPLLFSLVFYNDLVQLTLTERDAKQVESTSQKYGDMPVNTDNHYSPDTNVDFSMLPKQDVLVVIGDTGLDLTNPTFQSFLWTNPYEIPDNGIDDDGNGCVDDIHGCSFGLFSNNGDIQDEIGHGSQITGVIAGIPQNAVKLYEVDSRIHFVVAKCITNALKALTCPKAVDYATWLHTKTGLPTVVNLSVTWQYDPLNLWGRAIARANDAGVIIVAAAGNEGSYMHYPAGLSLEYENVISVAAVDDEGNIGPISNRYADIGAPGASAVKSVTLGGVPIDRDGTSISAPFVTQVVSILLKLYPKDPPNEIRKMVFDGSEKRAYLDNVIKEGRVLNPRMTLQPLKAYNAFPDLAH